MKRKQKPDYAKLVDLLTVAAIKEMIIPSLLPVLSPVVLYFIILAIGGLKNNPRVIIIQKLYGKFYNEDNDIEFPKHRFKKFIKDIVFGTIERNDLILDELNNKLGDDFVLDNL